MTAQVAEAQPAQAVASRRPLLRVVRSSRRPARTLPFVLLVVGLLGSALVGLLLLNTQRAQLSFRAATLGSQVSSLQDQQQQLQREVENDQNPATLASRATALGMVPETQPGFVGANGTVIGAVPSGAPVPAKGATAQGGVIVAGAGAPAADPKVTSQASTAPTAKTSSTAKAPTGSTPSPKSSASARPTTSTTSKAPSTQSSRSSR